MVKTKKLYALSTVTVAAVAAVLVPVAEASTQKFSDVPETSSHFEAIESLVSRDVIRGYEDGTYRPNATLTRGQAAKILANVLELDTSKIGEQFSDVSASFQYNGAIHALAALGIISGYEDGSFKPNAPLTRGQMAKILVQAFELEQVSTKLPFTDVTAKNGYKPFIETLVHYNITQGTTATTYSPSEPVKRGQMASFVVRAEKSKQNEAQQNPLEGTVEATITTIQQHEIVLGEQAYTIPAELRALFSPSNLPALQGATVNVTITGNELKEIKQLTVTTPSTAENPVVLDGSFIKEPTASTTTVGNTNKTTFNGILKINTPYIRLKNIHFANEVLMTKAVKHVTISDTINKLTLEQDVEAAIAGAANIAHVSVASAKKLQFEFSGEIAKLQAFQKSAIYLNKQLKVLQFDLPANLTVKDVIANYAELGLEKASASSGGGGGKRPVTPAPSPTPQPSPTPEPTPNPTPPTEIVYNANVPSRIEAAGYYGSHTEKIIINGDLIISTQDVFLKNVIVMGNLIIEESVSDGDVELLDTEVKGTAFVNGGGENSVYFINSLLPKVIVDKKSGAVRIVAQGRSRIMEVYIQTNSIIEEDSLTHSATGFENVFISQLLNRAASSNQDVTLDGEFNLVHASAYNTRLHLTDPTYIEQLILDTVMELIGTGVIREARVLTSGSSFAQRPQNLILRPGETVTINEQNISQSYASEEVAQLSSIHLTQGAITLNLSKFVTGVTANDFVVTATLDGQEIPLTNIVYDEQERQLTFTPITVKNNIGKTLTVTVTPKTAKIDETTVTASYEIAQGFGGKITDRNGLAIANATIVFRAAPEMMYDEYYAKIVTESVTEDEIADGILGKAETDAQGNYFVQLPLGEYVGEIYRHDIIPTRFEAYSMNNEFNTQQNGVAVRLPEGNELKVKVSWNRYFGDLQAALKANTNDHGDYVLQTDATQVMDGDQLVAMLELQETTDFGEEIYTLRDVVDGYYQFSLNDMSLLYDNLENIGLKVEIYDGSGIVPIATFTPIENDIERAYYSNTSWQPFHLAVSNDGEKIEVVEKPAIVAQADGEYLYSEYFSSNKANASLMLETLPGIELRYALNEEATLESSLFKGAFDVSESGVLHVIAVKDGKIVNEKSITILLRNNRNILEFKVDGLQTTNDYFSTNKESVLLEVVSSPGTEVRYAFNKPATLTSTLYSEPLQIDESTSVYFAVIKNGEIIGTRSASIYVEPQLETVKVRVNGRILNDYSTTLAYGESVQVSLQAAEGIEIRYRRDNVMEQDELYTQPLMVTNSESISIELFKEGKKVGSRWINVYIPVVQAKANGELIDYYVDESKSVVFELEHIEGIELRYEINRQATPISTLYTGPLSINHSSSISVIAMKDGVIVDSQSYYIYIDQEYMHIQNSEKDGRNYYVDDSIATVQFLEKYGLEYRYELGKRVTDASPIYTAPFELKGSNEIYYRAYENGKVVVEDSNYIHIRDLSIQIDDENPEYFSPWSHYIFKWDKQSIKVTLKSENGLEIRYRMDGQSEEQAIIYTGPFEVRKSRSYIIDTYENGILISSNRVYIYIDDLKVPITVKVNGEVKTNSSIDVKANNATITLETLEGYELRYALNEDVTENSPLYGGPIVLKESTVIRTAVYKDGEKWGEREVRVNLVPEIESFNVLVDGEALTPTAYNTFSVKETSLAPVPVALTAAEGIEIRYAYGQPATKDSPIYTTPLQLDRSQEVYVLLLKDGEIVGQGKVTVTIDLIEFLIDEQPPSNYEPMNETALLSVKAPEGTTIRYGFDNDYSWNSRLYGGPLKIAKSRNVYVYVYKDGELIGEKNIYVSVKSVHENFQVLANGKSLTFNTWETHTDHSDSLAVEAVFREGLEVRYIIGGSNQVTPYSTLYTGPLNFTENMNKDITFGILKHGEVVQQYTVKVALENQQGAFIVKSNGQELTVNNVKYYFTSVNESGLIELMAEEGVDIYYTIDGKEQLYRTPFTVTETKYIYANLFQGEKQVGSKTISVYVTPTSSVLMPVQPAIMEEALEIEKADTFQIVGDEVTLRFEPSIDFALLEALQLNDIQLTSADVANVAIENGELIFTVSPEVAQQLQLATEITVDATYLDAKGIRQTFYTEFLQLVE